MSLKWLRGRIYFGPQALSPEGILIVGSGNIVHNLKVMNWKSESSPYAWATGFDGWVKDMLEKRDFSALTEKFHETVMGRLGVPTVEHYYPLLYILGASYQGDELRFHFEELHHASISMGALSF